MTIWKIEIPVSGDPQTVEMPYGARILHVAAQYYDAQWVTLWALVDPDAEMEMRTFQTFGTGWELPELVGSTWCEYVGTAIFHGGQFVWHVFEIREGAPT